MQRLRQSGNSKYALLFVGGLWTAISCCVFVPMIGGLAGTGVFSGNIDRLELLGEGAFPLLFGGCFVGIGLFTMALGLRPIIAGTRVGKPEIHISTTNLRSGDEFTLSYRQAFKSQVEVNRIALQLVLRESATYRRGTDSVTVTHEHPIQLFEAPARVYESGETFSQNLRWAIPRGAMHTFVAKRNKLRWLVKAKVELKGWPDFEEEFEMTVAPELAL